MDVFSCSGVVVAMPCVTLAGGFGIGVVGAVMNSKMQGVCAWAVVGIGIVVGVFSCGVVFVHIPKIALARCFGIGVVGAVMDS